MPCGGQPNVCYSLLPLKKREMHFNVLIEENGPVAPIIRGDKFKHPSLILDSDIAAR